MNRNIVYLVKGSDSKWGSSAGPGPDDHRKRAAKSKPSKPLSKAMIKKIKKANPIMSKSVQRRLGVQLGYNEPIGYQF